MKLLILNGSPKAGSKACNTDIFIRHLTSEMQKPWELKAIYHEQPRELAQMIKAFDTVLIVMPLYIHAMPSGVMKLIEHLEPAVDTNQSIGFMIQAGFPESAHEKYVCDYFEVLAQRLGYHYLGTVVKGGAAFVYQRPDHHNKLYKSLAELGRIFETTGCFDQKIMEKLALPHHFGKFDLKLLRLLDQLGLMETDWNKMLKENHALEHAKDQPFLEAIRE